MYPFTPYKVTEINIDCNIDCQFIMNVMVKSPKIYVKLCKQHFVVWIYDSYMYILRLILSSALNITI